MKKKVIAAWAKFAGCIILLLLLAVVSKSIVFVFLACAVLVVSIVSVILNISAAKHITLRFEAPPTCAKSAVPVIKLIIDNQGKIPAGKLLCSVVVENRLSGEASEIVLEAAVPGKAQSSTSFTLQTTHCGFITASIKKACITDWFGLWLKKIKSNAKGEMSILPDTFMPQIDITIPPVTPQDEDAYSPDKKGYDYSEVFQLREYAEQDSLKQIHWKLSGKLDKLIVRDGSLPVAKSILVFWDKNARSASAEEIDAMAEAFCSICEGLSDMGVPYTLGYSCEQGCALEEIDSTDSFLNVIPSLFKDGCTGNGLSGVERYTEQYGKALFGKVICLCAGLPRGLEEFASSNLTLISFDDISGPDAYSIRISPENYVDELSMVEL